jgi:TPR repeat protein
MTEAALRSVNAQLAQSNPGRVYMSEFTAYPEINLKPESYGIINKVVAIDAPPKASNISAIYAVRDYSQIKYADIASREITARYFISKAQEMGMKGDRQGFENYRFLAEKTCPDNPGIMSTIASAYFYGTGDMAQSVKYLEKAVSMDPYFMGAIRLLTRLYGQHDVNEARKWAEIYVQREWDKKKVEEVKKEFGL